LVPAFASAQGFKLNGPFTHYRGGGVGSPRIDPSGEWVVYLASQGAPVSRLYSARVDGTGSPIQLSPDGLAYPTIQFAPDGTVLFSDYRSVGVYRAPLDGSRPAAAVLTLEPGRVLSNFVLSADGKHYVYRTYVQSGGDLYELFSLQVGAGKRPILLASPTSWFELSSDGSRVVYGVGGDLYSVPIDG